MLIDHLDVATTTMTMCRSFTYSLHRISSSAGSFVIGFRRIKVTTPVTPSQVMIQARRKKLVTQGRKEGLREAFGKDI